MRGLWLHLHAEFIGIRSMRWFRLGSVVVQFSKSEVCVCVYMVQRWLSIGVVVIQLWFDCIWFSGWVGCVVMWCSICPDLVQLCVA